MLMLIAKLFSILMPFLKELLLGNKKIKKQERNINAFLIFGIIIIFSLLIVSNLTNAKLNHNKQELEKTITALKNDNELITSDIKRGSLNFSKLTEDYSKCLMEKDNFKNTVEILEELDCEAMKDSLTNRVINIQNGKCELNKVNLKHDMPELPKVSKTMKDDVLLGEIVLNYIVDLRKYITAQDIVIEEQKNNCK